MFGEGAVFFVRFLVFLGSASTTAVVVGVFDLLLVFIVHFPVLHHVIVRFQCQMQTAFSELVVSDIVCKFVIVTPGANLL